MVTSKLVKRGFLAMAFATAFALVSFATPTDAEARGCRGGGWGGGWGGHYGGYSRSFNRSYNSFYRGGGFYSQPSFYHVGRPVVYNYGRGGGFYYGGRGVSIGVGF